MLTALFWLGWAALSSSWTKMYSSSIVLWRKCCEEVAWRVCWCAIFYNSRSINFLLYCRRIHLVITTKNKSKNNYVNQCFSFQSKKKIYRLDFFFLFRPRQKKKVDVFKRESWMGLTSMEMVAQSGARAHSVFAFDFFWKQLFLRAQAQTSWQEEEYRVAIWPFFKTARQIWNDTTICPIFGLLWIGLKKMFLFIALFWKYLSKTYTFLKKISKMFSYFIKFSSKKAFFHYWGLGFLKQLMGKFGLLNFYGPGNPWRRKQTRALFSYLARPAFHLVWHLELVLVERLKSDGLPLFWAWERTKQRRRRSSSKIIFRLCDTSHNVAGEPKEKESVCVCERQRERDRVYVWERKRGERDSVCVCVCVRERERDGVCVFVYESESVCERERERASHPNHSKDPFFSSSLLSSSFLKLLLLQLFFAFDYDGALPYVDGEPKKVLRLRIYNYK